MSGNQAKTQLLKQKGLNPTQPLVANFVAFEKGIMFRFGEFDQGAVRQEPSGVSLRHRGHNKLALRHAN